MILHAPQAFFSGSPRFFAGPGFAHDWLTGWTDAASKIWFEMDVVRPGDYAVELRYACPAADAGAEISITAGDARLEATVPAAEAPVIPLAHRDQTGRGKYVNRQWGSLPLGRLPLPAGRNTMTIQAQTCPGQQVPELKEIVLRRE